MQTSRAPAISVSAESCIPAGLRLGPVPGIFKLGKYLSDRREPGPKKKVFSYGLRCSAGPCFSVDSGEAGLGEEAACPPPSSILPCQSEPGRDRGAFQEWPEISPCRFGEPPKASPLLAGAGAPLARLALPEERTPKPWTATWGDSRGPPVPAARCRLLAARCPVPGARFAVPDSWFLVPGARCPVPEGAALAAAPLAAPGRPRPGGLLSPGHCPHPSPRGQPAGDGPPRRPAGRTGQDLSRFAPGAPAAAAVGAVASPPRFVPERQTDGFISRLGSVPPSCGRYSPITLASRAEGGDTSRPLGSGLGPRPKERGGGFGGRSPRPAGVQGAGGASGQPSPSSTPRAAAARTFRSDL